MSQELTGKQKRTLRALGHHLRPVTTIGKGGVVDPLVTQVEANLLARKHLPPLLSPSGRVAVELHTRLSGWQGSGRADIIEAQRRGRGRGQGGAAG